MKRVLIAAGGTGGHIYPGLAVADALRAQGVDVFWLGAVSGLEVRLVGPHYPLTCLSITGLRGKGIFSWFLAPINVCRAIIQAICALRSYRPEVVIGFGGFASAPACVAAWCLRLPVIIHEQNAVPGLTNRCLSRLARLVFQAFPNSFSRARRAETIGNPVRAAICSVPLPAERFAHRSPPLRVLVLGGSRGAHALNLAVRDALAEYLNRHLLALWHQTGESDAQALSDIYGAYGPNYRAQAYIDPVVQAYAWADLVVCRAGASTVSELAAVGVASLLVPYPHAVDDHQYQNARYLADAGAAVIIREKDLTTAYLSALWDKFIASPERLNEMACRARGLAQVGAVARIVSACDSVVG